MAAKLWYYLRKVPAGLWWALTVFFGGLMLGLRVMGTRVKVQDAKRTAGARREALRDAAEDGGNERLREELLKSLKEKE